MKSKVLDRPMFKKPNKDVDPENVGIMQGFADMLDEDELKAFEGEDDGESKDYDTSEMKERTPKTPEILMNNLRGDMRSIDARVEELADLVGYNAAASTPTEVLALLQPVLAAEAQKGIGALPAAGMSQTPPGMMPPAMPDGMPPGMPPPGMPPAAGPGMDMPPVPETTPAGMPAGGIESLMAGAGGPAPVNMYQGGLVQRFQAGSTEEGVTPAATTSVGSWPAENIVAARQKIAEFLSRQPLQVPDLAAETKKRVPLYEQILGIDRNVAQGQALMDIGQAAFNYAANVDEQGRPLRGSGIARLARAVAPLPGKLGARVAEQAKADQAIKLTALQATEAEIAKLRDYNMKLVNEQLQQWQTIAKSTPPSPFGTGKEGRILTYFTQLAPNYGAGKTSPDEDRVFEAAVRDYTQRQEVETIDPVTGNKSIRVIRNELPSFVTAALGAREKLSKAAPKEGAPSASATRAATASRPEPQGSGTRTQAPAPAPAPAPARTTTATEAVSQEQEGAAGGTPGGTGIVPPGGVPVVRTPQPPDYVKVDPFSVNPRFQSYYSKSAPNLFMASEFATGPVSAVGAGAYRTPIIGPSLAKPFGGKTAAQAREYVGNTIGALTRSLSENPNFPVYEQKSIKAELDLLPQLYDNPTAFRSRLFALDDLLIQSQDTALANSTNQQLPTKDRQMARAKVAEIHKIRELIGSPLRIDSVDDPRFAQVPEGVWFLWNGNEWKRRLPAQQRGQ
jgi:hypothetical protein